MGGKCNPETYRKYQRDYKRMKDKRSKALTQMQHSERILKKYQVISCKN